MTERTYLYLFGNTRLTLAQLETKWTWAHSHPETNRRVIAMLNDCQDAGGDPGVGEASRSTANQATAFFDRHYVVSSGGCCTYQGKRYALKSGKLHAAPPGLSVHEDGLYEGYSMAYDLRGWENHWMDANCSRYGLKNFGGKIGPNVNNEEHHFQPIEFANSRSAIIAQIKAGVRLMVWPLPGDAVSPEPAPKPPVVVDPAPPVTLKDDLMITIFKPKECDAQFIGMTDKNGNALEIEWISSDPKDVSRRDQHWLAGARIEEGPVTGGQFRNCILNSAIPVGDTRYNWTAADFYKVRP